MTRATIDFGIDLGTTNSSIACCSGVGVEVIKNSEGPECTPSAVWIDAKGRIHVGRRAKEQVDADSENACMEFKLQMGTSWEKAFQRSGRRMAADDLSAEVLKSLLADARHRYSEDIREAVITVPAAFDLPQCKATRRSAEMAGLSKSPLILEPQAAALAYGLHSDRDQDCFLVYDLGGGTFDAALIQSLGGEFRLVNHGGDRFLGGKLIDWSIVDQLLVPEVLRQHRLADFERGNVRWITAFAKLKLAAEHAKIIVSRNDSAEFNVAFTDENGRALELEFEIKRADVERLIEPIVERSINICKKVVAAKGLGLEVIERVVLVGGPTLTPYLRERLADGARGLGRPLDYSLDPMTVVARGAALFAGMQRAQVTSAPETGCYVLDLEYQPVATEPEPFIGGKVLPPSGQNLAGFTIEFVDPNARPPRQTGKLPLDANGAFSTTLWGEKGRTIQFRIELCDAAGRKQKTDPPQFPYTLGGMDPITVPLIHTLGIAMSNNEVHVAVAKGTDLPFASKPLKHRTTKPLYRGQAGDLLRIPVVEGENLLRADRNRRIGSLEISARDVKRDVPAGSEIEITIEIDQSRQLTTRAHLAILGEHYEHVIVMDDVRPSPDQLRREFNEERSRLHEVQVKANHSSDAKVQAALERIEREQIVHEVEVSLSASTVDRDAADKCQNRLLDMKIAIDEVESAMEWPALVTEAESTITHMWDVVSMHGRPGIGFGGKGDRDSAKELEEEARQAMSSRDADLLRRKNKEMYDFGFRLEWEQPEYQARLLHYLKSQRAVMRDPNFADQLIEWAEQALRVDNLQALQTTNRQLWELLPSGQQEKEIRPPGEGDTVKASDD